MNNHKLNILSVGLMGFILCFSGTVQANLFLVFTVDETLTKKDEQPKTTNKKLSVDIGSDYFSYEDNQEKVIFDFKKERIYDVNLPEGAYHDDSLFMNIGFRAYEFQNRLFLQELLEKSGIKDNPMPVTMSEHIFSVTKKDHKPGIKKKKTRGETVFIWEEKKLLGHSPDLLKVDEKYRLGFVRFFRYYQAGHPQILQELGRLKGIPFNLEIYTSNIVDTTTVLKLETHTVTPEKAYDLAGLKKLPIDGELSTLISADRLYTQAALYAKAKEVMSGADKAYTKKRYLDSMVGYIEYNLMTGESLPAEFQPKREVLVQDDEVRKMLSSIEPKSKEEAEKAVGVLVELRNRSKDKKHMLMIFEANVRNSLKQPVEAKNNFLAVLAINPYIVGAWKDLGDIFFNEYNTQDAWRCWDLARELLPTHGLLKGVNAHEQKLMDTYPEFF